MIYVYAYRVGRDQRCCVTLFERLLTASIFWYSYSIVEHADRISRELDSERHRTYGV